MTYEEAYKALQSILADMESGETPLHKLPNKVKEASELIRFCKDELRGIEHILSDTVYEEE